MSRLHSQLPKLEDSTSLQIQFNKFSTLSDPTENHISHHISDSPPNGNACAFQLPSQQMLHRLPWNMGFWLHGQSNQSPQNLYFWTLAKGTSHQATKNSRVALALSDWSQGRYHWIWIKRPSPKNAGRRHHGRHSSEDHLEQWSRNLQLHGSLNINAAQCWSLTWWLYRLWLWISANSKSFS